MKYDFHCKRKFLKFSALIFFIFFGAFSGKGQEDQLSVYLDSLAKSSADSDKARLSMRVALQLVEKDWERALFYMDLAEKSAVNSGSEKVVADNYNYRGYIYSRKNVPDLALASYLKAYDYYETRPIIERYKIENDLAVSYAQTNNPEKAVEYFRKLFSYEETEDRKMNMAAIANNMGRVWQNKSLDSALYYYHQSIDLMEGVDYPPLSFSLYTNLGRGYTHKNDFDLAREYFDLAMDEIAPQTPLTDVAWVYSSLSELYLNKKAHDSAVVFSEKAVKILDSVAPYGFEQQSALEILYKAYIANKDFEKATQQFSKYLTVMDSINISDKKANVTKLLLEQEYRNIDKIKQLEVSKEKANTYSIILGLVVLLLFLGFLLFRYRNKLRNTKLETELALANQNRLDMELELKRKELIAKAMMEMHQTEMIREILEDLKDIKLKTDKKEVRTAIDYVANRLKRDSNSNLWEEFQLRFEQVHESFYQNLVSRHPDLSPKDKRLCALLKLNLTSKEIAQLTGQSSKSVENALLFLFSSVGIF